MAKIRFINTNNPLLAGKRNKKRFDLNDLYIYIIEIQYYK